MMYPPMRWEQPWLWNLLTPKFVRSLTDHEWTELRELSPNEVEDAIKRTIHRNIEARAAQTIGDVVRHLGFLDEREAERLPGILRFTGEHPHVNPKYAQHGAIPGDLLGFARAKAQQEKQHRDYERSIGVRSRKSAKRRGKKS